MTSNKEDYLKVIYEEGGLDTLIPNKIISEKLNVTPASVTEMLTKLQQQGLIAYKAYKGSRLTEQGLAACIDVVRSHRLWEVFLRRHLGYSLREAHEEAHLLEHSTSERMVDRLDVFLNHPQACPHGSLIPQKGEVPGWVPLSRLCDLMVGETALVSRVQESGELLDYLEKSGLKIGERVQMKALDEYEGPITLLQGDKTITISHKAATQIFVAHEDDAK